jgi:hypothetical protein
MQQMRRLRDRQKNPHAPPWLHQEAPADNQLLPVYQSRRAPQQLPVPGLVSAPRREGLEWGSAARFGCGSCALLALHDHDKSHLPCLCNPWPCCRAVRAADNDPAAAAAAFVTRVRRRGTNLLRRVRLLRGDECRGACDAAAVHPRLCARAALFPHQKLARVIRELSQVPELHARVGKMAHWARWFFGCTFLRGVLGLVGMQHCDGNAAEARCKRAEAAAAEGAAAEGAAAEGAAAP